MPDCVGDVEKLRVRMVVWTILRCVIVHGERSDELRLV